MPASKPEVPGRAIFLEVERGGLRRAKLTGEVLI